MYEIQKRDLEIKRVIARDIVTDYALLAAANDWLNPLPGVDMAVDVGLFLKMFSEIMEVYGIRKHTLELAVRKSYALRLAVRAKRLLTYLTTEGIMLLLERFVAQETAEHILKYIPFIGQIAAGAIAFGVTKAIGNDFVDTCHELASEMG